MSIAYVCILVPVRLFPVQKRLLLHLRSYICTFSWIFVSSPVSLTFDPSRNCSALSLLLSYYYHHRLYRLGLRPFINVYMKYAPKTISAEKYEYWVTFPPEKRLQFMDNVRIYAYSPGDKRASPYQFHGMLYSLRIVSLVLWLYRQTAWGASLCLVRCETGFYAMHTIGVYTVIEFQKAIRILFAW